MIEMTFSEFAKGDYPDFYDGGEEFSLYVVSDDSRTLYVGISRDNIYNRWFGESGRSHMLVLNDGSLVGNSSVGRFIASKMPESLKYRVQLYTYTECVDLLKDEKTFSMLGPGHLSKLNEARGLQIVEIAFIVKLKPVFNKTHNNQPPTKGLAR